jgi:hypothetical protein
MGAGKYYQISEDFGGENREARSGKGGNLLLRKAFPYTGEVKTSFPILGRLHLQKG